VTLADAKESSKDTIHQATNHAKQVKEAASNKAHVGK
jgi:hypothetical protein